MAGLGLTVQQKLQAKLTPSQLMVIRMLELPTMELQQRITEELQVNPALEEGPDPEAREQETPESDGEDEMLYDDLEESYRMDEENRREYDAADDDYEPILYGSGSGSGEYENDYSSRELPYGGDGLIDYLKSQVYLTHMTKPQRHIAKWVLGNIDDDGYLRRTTEQLVDDLAFQEGLQVSDEEMADIVGQIKQFDPPGIAAATLQECLLTQLRQKEQTPPVMLAQRVLTRAFKAFSKRNYDQVMQRLHITEDAFREAVAEIMRLNQSPTNAFASTDMDSRRTMIIPDFEVRMHDGQLRINLLTDDLPEIHINADYPRMLQDMREQRKNAADKEKAREAVEFIRTNIQQASTFIDAIRQRNETLLMTMTAIVEKQKAFFMEGDEALIQPLVLQDVADMIQMDASTVSRACNNKYVRTDYGVYPLKFFFSEVRMPNEQGEVSTRAIKQQLRELVDEEDKTAPLSDDQLVEQLAVCGYTVARRTVAKYREQLNIPVARLRREI